MSLPNKIKWNEVGYAYGKAYTDGKTVEFDVSTKTYKNVWARVDIKDWENIRAKRWSATKRDNGYYVSAQFSSKIVLLHRFLMNPPENKVVDHINGEPTNNTRENLRICSHAENMYFGVLRRTNKPPKSHQPKTNKKRVIKPHIVTMKLADGTVKKYTYPPRIKNKREHEK